MRKFFWLVIVLVMVGGCATMPSPEEIASLDYGSRVTVDYKSTIKSYMSNTLYDPYTAHFQFGTPTQFWFSKPPLRGGGIVAGYAVATRINAKNKLGAYVGYKPYVFMFKNNQIIDVMGPGELKLTSGGALAQLFSKVPNVDS